MYTYGKTLLTPGQRLGYVAMPPTMPERQERRKLILAAQMIQGWTFPNALMQYALPDLEKQSIDVVDLQRKRDRLVGALRDMSGFNNEVYRLSFVVSRSTVAWSFLVVIVAAMLSGLMVRRRLDRLDLVAVLKTRE